MGSVGAGGSYGKQDSRSSGQFNESVYAPQGEALTDLYGNAATAYDNVDATGYNQAGNRASGYTQGVADQSMPGYRDLERDRADRDGHLVPHGDADRLQHAEDPLLHQRVADRD